MWCPCCGYRVRTRPRGQKFKERLRVIKQKEEEEGSPIDNKEATSLLPPPIHLRNL
jgi:hypothetical protein